MISYWLAQRFAFAAAHSAPRSALFRLRTMATMAYQVDVERPLSSSTEPWYRKFYDVFDYPAVRDGPAAWGPWAGPPNRPPMSPTCRIRRRPPRAQNKCLHELFGEQADRTPDRPCIADPRRNTSYTFAEVDRLTDEIAEWLVSRGCGPDKVRGGAVTEHRRRRHMTVAPGRRNLHGPARRVLFGLCRHPQGRRRLHAPGARLPEGRGMHRFPSLRSALFLRVLTVRPPRICF